MGDAIAVMTPGAERALCNLTAKQRAFALAYVGEAGGSATRAAELAGYVNVHVECSRLMTHEGIREAIAALRAPEDESRIATVRELRSWWTGIVRDHLTPLKDRLKASEMLGKSQGAFVERIEVSPAPPNPHAEVLEILDVLDAMEAEECP